MITRRIKKSALAACLSASLSTLLYLPALAQNMSLNDHHAFTEKLVQGESWQPGNAFLDKAYQQVCGFKDYVFDSSLTANKNGKSVQNGGKFFFKKEHQLRVEVHSKGNNNGAVVVKRQDGVIRGAGGGMLKFMKMNLQHDSRMLMLPNGINVVDSDFKSLFDRVRKNLKSGATAKVTANSVPCYNWSGKVKIIDIKNGNQLKDRILVSTTYNVPVEWNLYKNGKLVSIALFKKFKPNLGLSDKLFDI